LRVLHVDLWLGGGRVAYRPLRGSFRLTPLISTSGMSIFLQNCICFDLQGCAESSPCRRSSREGFTVFERRFSRSPWLSAAFHHLVTLVLINGSRV
jgi:branched-subunit amino acid ABC-type transport system permease component